LAAVFSKWRLTFSIPSKISIFVCINDLIIIVIFKFFLRIFRLLIILVYFLRICSIKSFFSFFIFFCFLFTLTRFITFAIIINLCIHICYRIRPISNVIFKFNRANALTIHIYKYSLIWINLFFIWIIIFDLLTIFLNTPRSTNIFIFNSTLVIIKLNFNICSSFWNLGNFIILEAISIKFQSILKIFNLLILSIDTQWIINRSSFMLFCIDCLMLISLDIIYFAQIWIYSIVLLKSLHILCSRHLLQIISISWKSLVWFCSSVIWTCIT